MHDTHDEPGQPTSWELEFVLRELQAVESRLQGQLNELKRRLGSNPPDSAELRKGDWRLRAPWWVVVVLLLLVLAIVAVWRVDDLAQAFR